MGIGSYCYCLHEATVCFCVLMWKDFFLNGVCVDGISRSMSCSVPAIEFGSVVALEKLSHVEISTVVYHRRI